MSDRSSDSLLPRRPVQRLTRPFVHFLHVESTSGIALIAATVVALVLANSPAAASYSAFFNTPISVGVGTAELRYPLWYWINDALMAIFFFVIGLEIKREMVLGELRDRRQLVLPVAAAVGGAAVPVGVFLAFNLDGDAQRGWAIPMATDIAFVVGCLALLGPRVPRGLKILMLALAIVDDIMAVLVIALFYSSGIKVAFLAAALAGFAVIVGLNAIRVRAIAVYVLTGAFIWLCTLKSGIHPTVAGALLGLLTPSNAWIERDKLMQVMESSLQRLREDEETAKMPARTMGQVGFAAREALAPVERLERDLHPWVAFLNMPVFALANAGVPFEAELLTEPLAMAVAAGLVVGKPLGIALACWLVVQAKWVRLPEGVSPLVVVGGGCLAGIGFTMALFIASLGLEGSLLAAAKVGVLSASLVSALLGFAILRYSLPRGARAG